MAEREEVVQRGVDALDGFETCGFCSGTGSREPVTELGHRTDLKCGLCAGTGKRPKRKPLVIMPFFSEEFGSGTISVYDGTPEDNDEWKPTKK